VLLVSDLNISGEIDFTHIKETTSSRPPALAYNRAQNTANERIETYGALVMGKTLKNVAGSALLRASCSKSSQDAMMPE